MRHIPAYCPEIILAVRPGQTLAGCDWKEIVYLGRDTFYVRHYANAWRKRGFNKARTFYNSLPMAETKKACL